MTSIVYSAYNAAPMGLSKDTEGEDLWYKALRAEHRIGGLELPALPGGLHPQGLHRLAHLLDPRWSNTVSAMPLTLVASKSDPAYGLASADPAGRQHALEDIDSIRQEALRLQALLGEASVRAFAIQSAPRADRSNPDAFTESLRTITSWDWGRIELLVEHSDALIAGQVPQKGYLSLQEEMSAVRSVTNSGSPRVRHLLNWGRSAIEGRSAATPGEHIDTLGEALGAFAFSGAGPAATNRSRAWEDAHLGLAIDEPESLLISDELRAVVAKLPDALAYLGIKAGAPAGSHGLDRLQLGLSMLAVLADPATAVDL
ncbi:DUF4862 family protein [Arthrobacter sp. MPF02]|uniref:DUF4862 family protein n=1 Tax=Arthrobacter sp. MPF02 TaxID=3388492 RepID=UPI00398487A8